MTSQTLSRRARLASLAIGSATLVLFVLPGAAEPAFPGANGRIAFQGFRDGGSAIYTMNSDGTGQTRLTDLADFAGLPAWSPDGQTIAFTRGGEIYVMAADGSGQVQLTNLQGATSPAWSPDGRRIAFTKDVDSYPQIWVMNADGSGKTRLTNDARIDRNPAWSPDGQTIAFASDRDRADQQLFEIYTMRTDGSDQTRLTKDPIPMTSYDEPAWSPDGRKIAFDAAGVIAVMNADGSAQTAITTGYDDSWPAWSPDGQKIAFTRQLPSYGYQIYVANADGSGTVSRLSTGTSQDLLPDWGTSPDLDLTSPTTTIGLSPAAPDGQNGWYVSSVHASVTAADNAGGSGVAETRCALDPTTAPDSFADLPSQCSFAASGADVVADGQHTLYAASADGAGNKESPVSVSFKVDRTAPTVTCGPAPTFILGSSGGPVTAPVADATSGPAQASISAAVTNVDTATPGTKTTSLTGYDTAGNANAINCPYTVGYAFGGFYSPVDNPPVVNLGKVGRTYPVKFSLRDAAGNYISSLAAVTEIRYKQVICGAFTNDPTDALETTASGGSMLRYDATVNQFVYNWQTPSSTGCYALFVRTADASIHEADFQLK
jgi:Tol biopolymer transport system component